MTYSIRMFGRSANPVAHLAYHELVSALTATDSTIAQVGDLHQGVGWVGFDVTSDRPGARSPRSHRSMSR